MEVQLTPIKANVVVDVNAILVVVVVVLFVVAHYIISSYGQLMLKKQELF